MKMTLHEAMIYVLAERKCLPTAEIARQINILKLYTRSDNRPLPGSQISARARKYPDLFIRDNGNICVKSRASSVLKKEAKPQSISRKEFRYASDIKTLNELEFRDIGLIGDLFDYGLHSESWLESCGIYKISTPADYEPDFISPEEARLAGNVISPWLVPRLEEKWVSNATIVYIGLAGSHTHRSLRKRLGDLLKHGSGHTSDRGPHKGGEILWQLRGYLNFKISAAPTANPPIPRKMEERLLQEFLKQYGKLPFANRQM